MITAPDYNHNVGADDDVDVLRTDMMMIMMMMIMPQFCFFDICLYFVCLSILLSFTACHS